MARQPRRSISRGSRRSMISRCAGDRFLRHSDRIEPFCFLWIAVSGSSAASSIASQLSSSLEGPAPHDLVRLIAGDAQQPCRYLGTAFERFGLAPDVEEHLTHNVFGDTFVGDEAQCKAGDASAV